MNPKVSVIILSHRKEFLPKAIESVVEQTYENIQMLVQYDKENWPDKINEITSSAKGDAFVHLCDDDLLDKDYVGECVEAIMSDYTAGIAFTDRIVFGRYVGEIKSKEFIVENFLGSYACPLPMTVMVKKKVWQEMGGYRGHVPYSDWDFLWNMCKKGYKGIRIPKSLFYYNVHNESLSSNTNHEAHRAEFFKYNPDLWESIKHKSFEQEMANPSLAIKVAYVMKPYNG